MKIKQMYVREVFPQYRGIMLLCSRWQWMFTKQRRLCSGRSLHQHARLVQMCVRRWLWGRRNRLHWWLICSIWESRSQCSEWSIRLNKLGEARATGRLKLIFAALFQYGMSCVYVTFRCWRMFSRSKSVWQWTVLELPWWIQVWVRNGICA